MAALKSSIAASSFFLASSCCLPSSLSLCRSQPSVLQWMTNWSTMASGLKHCSWKSYLTMLLGAWGLVLFKTVRIS